MAESLNLLIVMVTAEDDILSYSEPDDPAFSGFDPRRLTCWKKETPPPKSSENPSKMNKKDKGKHPANPKLSVTVKNTKNKAKKLTSSTSAGPSQNENESTSFQQIIESLTGEEIVKLEQVPKGHKYPRPAPCLNV